MREYRIGDVVNGTSYFPLTQTSPPSPYHISVCLSSCGLSEEFRMNPIAIQGIVFLQRSYLTLSNVFDPSYHSQHSSSSHSYTTSSHHWKQLQSTHSHTLVVLVQYIYTLCNHLVFFISDFLRRCVSAMYISSLFWTTLVWLRWTEAYTLRPALSRREYNIEIIHDNTASTPRPTLHLSSQDDVGHCLKKSLTPRLWKEMKMDEHLRLFPKGYNLSLTVSFKALTKLHTSETDGKARLPCAGLCRCRWRHQLSVRYWSPMQPFSGEQSDISWSQKVVIAEQLTLSHSDRSVRV